jgi:TonB family protein
LKAVRRVVSEWWPFVAAGGATLMTLVAVHAMLRPRGPGPGAAEGPAGIPATVTVAGAELKREPSAKSEDVVALDEGARVRIRGERGLWVEVETDRGQGGFLSAEDVERDADREARQRRAATLLAFPPVSGVVGEDTDILLAPYPLAARGGRLARGTVIPIHSVDHSYFAFHDGKWGIAFVASSSVDIVPPNPREPAITPEKIKPLKDLTIINLEGAPPEEEEPAEEGAASGGTPAVPGLAAPTPAPGEVRPAAVLKRVEPVYPDLARRMGIEGIVELEVSIDASGRASDVEIVRGLPLGLSEAAADAVRKWTYRPAQTAEGPVASRMTIRVRFTLQGGAAP